MEGKRNKINHSKKYEKDFKTGIKEEHFYKDKVSAESEKSHLLHSETYFLECNEYNGVDFKIGIKQINCDPNVSTDIKSDPSILDLLPFTGTGTGDEVDIKKEHFNQDENLTEAQMLHFQENGVHFVTCNKSCDVDFKIEDKEKTWDPKVASSVIKSDAEESPMCLGTATVKVDEKIDINEETWWCVGASNSHNEGKDSNWEKNNPAKDILPLESPRLPREVVYYNGNCVTTLPAEKDGVAHKTACGSNASHELLFTENIYLLSSNPMGSNNDVDKNMGNEHTPVYQCEICEKCYMHKSSLKTHMLVHSTIKQYKCELCEKCFMHKSSLKTHKLVHSTIKQYKCEHCEKCFTWKPNLQSHKWIHSGTKPYACDKCHKRFTRNSSLQNHSLLHLFTKPYKCGICDKSFKHKSYLKCHILLHSGKKLYNCEKCQRCFITSSSLQRHSVIHSSIKPYNCDNCQKCFTTKSSLQRHLFLHLGTSPYKCDKCQKCFTSMSSLQSHSLLHLGLKPYKCDKCEKKFTKKYSLQSHSLLHLETKPYKCKICDKHFSMKSRLKRHTFIHSGKKPYKCDKCQKRFTRNSDLKIHSLFHSGLKPYNCDKCKRSFTRKPDLKRHKQIHSGT